MQLCAWICVRLVEHGNYSLVTAVLHAEVRSFQLHFLRWFLFFFTSLCKTSTYRLSQHSHPYVNLFRVTVEKCSWHVDKSVVISRIVSAVRRGKCLNVIGPQIVSLLRPFQLESAPILFVKKLNYRRLVLSLFLSLANLSSACNAKPLSLATQVFHITTDSIGLVGQLSSRAALPWKR